MTTLLGVPSRATVPLPPAAAPAPRGAGPRTRRPDLRRWHDGPTPVSLADLGEITRRIAAEVVDGVHEVHLDASDRWSRRLHADAHLDVWLIGWTTGQAAELHDHGGSIGALTVATGELTEWRWSPGEEPAGDAEQAVSRGPGLRRRALPAGRGAAFGLGHVHDVANRGLAGAVSVHAYSPPLSAMSYYAVEGGVLTRTRSELVAPGAPPE